MDIAVFGTGVVGQTIGKKLLELGHAVTLGSRSKENEKGLEWLEQVKNAGLGDRARLATFQDAAAGAELAFNCTSGGGSLAALGSAQTGLAGKILIDVSNPLDFSRGMPPTLSVCNDDSLAERIQAALPETRVVKALSTVTADLMVNGGLLPPESTLFVAGNDPEAKAFVVSEILHPFGWTSILDLGDITSARGIEMYLPLWLRLWGALKTPYFNVAIVKAG